MGCRELQIQDCFSFSGSGKTHKSGFRFIDETAYKADPAYERKTSYTGLSGYSVVVLNNTVNLWDKG